MAMRTFPPFRADHVGSLLRSRALARARAERARGELSAEELTKIEDRERQIKNAIDLMFFGV